MKKHYNPYEEAHLKAQRRKASYLFLAFLVLIMLLFILGGCKKKNTPPQNNPPYIPPPKPTWLLDGTWKCVSGDTMFTQNLVISYCCSGPNSTAVYNISYRIWCRYNSITVSSNYNTDSLWFDNCLVVGHKEVLFVRQ